MVSTKLYVKLLTRFLTLIILNIIVPYHTVIMEDKSGWKKLRINVVIAQSDRPSLVKSRHVEIVNITPALSNGFVICNLCG